MKQPMYMGHEYCGVVEEVGSAVKTVRPGQFCGRLLLRVRQYLPYCTFGFQSACEQREFMTGAQPPYALVALAAGALIATPGMPSEDMIPHLLATSDVLGTEWFAAEAASVKPGATVVVGHIVTKKRFSRKQLVTFTVNLPTCLMGIEACPGARFLARIFLKQGHDVKLMPAEYVRPFVKSNKNDYVDGEPIAEAVQRPTMRFVQVKNEAQLDLQVLHRVRDRWIGRKTAVINQLRESFWSMESRLLQGQFT